MIAGPKLPGRRHRPFQPKPRQLPKRKAVTIAIGLIVSDAVILAADSQETARNFMKTDVGKIMGLAYTSQTDGMGAIGIAGAGHPGYIDTFGDQLRGLFDGSRPQNADETTGTMAAALEDFYAKHVIPFDRYPPEDRPDFQLLIALQRRNKIKLLVTHLSVLHTVSFHTSIGIGAVHANTLLDRYYRHDLSISVAARLAAYAIFQVKRSVDGCGHFTQLAVIQKNWIDLTDVEVTQEWERRFRDYEESESRLLQFVLGAEEESSGSLSSMFRKHRALFSKDPSPKIPMMSSTAHTRSVTPAAMAGVTRSVS